MGVTSRGRSLPSRADFGNYRIAGRSTVFVGNPSRAMVDLEETCSTGDAGRREVPRVVLDDHASKAVIERPGASQSKRPCREAPTSMGRVSGVRDVRCSVFSWAKLNGAEEPSVVGSLTAQAILEPAA